MPNYVTAARCNRILDQLSHRRAQGIYNSGGVTDSAAEQTLTASKTLQVLEVYMELTTVI